MLTKITMPSGGTNTDQLRVISWKKKPGGAVKRGDILLEVETDKAMLEVESFAQGTLLKRLVEEGQLRNGRGRDRLHRRARRPESS
jgi:pyruvate dehydrogenase E2 component (dihydrolipoamide acetyltransferase)